MRALSRLAATGRAARRSRAFAPVLTSSNSVRCLATEAFVSRHYQMQDPKDVADFLRRKSLAVRETDSHFVVRDCPFCHATHGKADNLFKMYVHKTQGVYKCHRCGSAGSWFDFKHKLQGSVGVASASSALHGGSNAGAAVEVKIIQALDNEKAMAIQKNLLDDSEFEPVLKYLTNIRGLTKEVLQKYCVGAIEQPFWDHDAGERVNAKCISFPWMARQMDMNAMGVMCQEEKKQDSEDKNLYDVAKQQLVPKGGSWGLFGWNTVPAAADELVLTEGEFDAMAVHQATADRFEALPMYFLRFFGSTDVDEVLDAMDYAVYAYDVQHILLDNVQFMMAGQGRGYDKFERQDSALDKFRKFASAKNVHLTLVIHPRKEQEDQDLTLSSVFGTAKATQEADNVLILQRTRGESKLDIRKNRFDGTLGSIPLKFDVDSASLCEVGTEGMSEGVAAVDLEAEMEFAQKRRMQKSSRTHEDLHPEPMNGFEGDHSSQAFQYAAAAPVNGHSHPNGVNGHNGSYSFQVNGSSLPRLNGDDNDDHHLNGSSSGGPNGGSNGSRTNGGGEPFAAFTPIITR
eukprot:jgi/Phyca11/535923/estExt2_fgenesh1_pg.C_PHYCAscaffold_430078